METARLLLDCQGDARTFGRSLFESGLVRFHQQRRYLLDCIRLCIQIADDDELDTNLQDVFSAYVAQNIYDAGITGGTRIVSRCMEAMQGVKNWIQKLADRTTAASVFHGTDRPPIDEVFEYSRISLLQQHELLALAMANAIEKRHAKPDDFKAFLKSLERLDRYDQLLGMAPGSVPWRPCMLICCLVHLMPVIGTYITVFGSTEGNGDLDQAREFYKLITKGDDETWVLPYFHAAVRAWWIVEYSGLFVDAADGTDSLAGRCSLYPHHFYTLLNCISRRERSHQTIYRSLKRRCF